MRCRSFLRRPCRGLGWPSYAAHSRERAERFERLTVLELECFADPLGDRFELELGAGHVADELLGRDPLPLRPELDQLAAGLPGREPLVAVAAAQVVAQLGLRRPRAEVRGDVEA